MKENICDEIAGAAEFVQWFGEWPRFHDAEIVALEFRSNSAKLSIHISRRLKTLDERGYFESDKHVVVDFFLDKVSGIDLEGELAGTILFELKIELIEGHFRLNLDASCGISGTIEAKDLALNFMPADGQHG